MRLTAFYNWHKHLHCILTSLGSFVCLAHHLNLLLLHTILAHLRILANAHLVTGTLLRSTITDMARYNVELLYHDWTKIGNVLEGYRGTLDVLIVGVIPPDLRARPIEKVTFFRIAPLPFSPFLPVFLPFFMASSPDIIGLTPHRYAPPQIVYPNPQPRNPLNIKGLRGVVTTPTPKKT